MTYPTYPDGAVVDNTTPTPDGNLGWWLVMGTLPNSIPAMDTRCHVLGAGCWCSPLADGEIVSHNSADRRELYYQGFAKPH